MHKILPIVLKYFIFIHFSNYHSYIDEQPKQYKKGKKSFFGEKQNNFKL